VNPHVHLFFFAPRFVVDLFHQVFILISFLRGSAGKPVAHRKGKGNLSSILCPLSSYLQGDPGWRGNFILSAAEQWLKHELTKVAHITLCISSKLSVMQNFKLIRDLELLPQLLGQDWSSGRQGCYRRGPVEKQPISSLSSTIRRECHVSEILTALNFHADALPRIWPRTRFWDWVRILTDPDPQELERSAIIPRTKTLILTLSVE